jgi:kynurenine 3-monooxygenase
MIHEIGKPSLSLRYGQRTEEVLWSASRAVLHRLLVEAAADAGVDCRFDQALVNADFSQSQATLQDLASGRQYTIPMSPAIAADGASSAMRMAMSRDGLCVASEARLPHSYKELNIAPGAAGEARLDSGHLHIWPRGSHMLIALPNADNSLTATLFMPAGGSSDSFTGIGGIESARQFFERQFPDVLALIPDFDAQYERHPVSHLSTIYTDVWHVGASALLIGDAAHGIVPFHGQGLNCCFEDCLALDQLLETSTDWRDCFARFTALRRPNSDAIAQMALENYVEMRDTVRNPHFQLQKELSLALELRHPRRFIPRYSMVMFHAEIPYSAALNRGKVQAAILEEVTRDVRTLNEVDFALADRLIEERLIPLDG